VELSIALPTSGSWATPENITTIARAAEDVGCRGIWTFQRVLYPIDSDMPAVYRSVLDPLVCLGFAAAVTQRVRLGVAVVNGPFYAPSVLAKLFATADVLSAGRLDAGIGLGWHPAEYASVGLPMKQRGRRFDEFLDCLHALLTDDPVSFAGEFYTVPDSHVLPRPVQQPRPPIYIGGSSEAAYRRAGARGNGFVSSSRASLDDVRSAMEVVRAAADAAGNPSPRCIVRGVVRLRDEPVAASGRALLHGTLTQVRDDIETYAQSGAVDELFLDLNFDSDEVGSPDADAQRSMDKAHAVLELISTSRPAPAS
jgi:probable F420-dependent oxidoreductase